MFYPNLLGWSFGQDVNGILWKQHPNINSKCDNTDLLVKALLSDWQRQHSDRLLFFINPINQQVLFNSHVLIAKALWFETQQVSLGVVLKVCLLLRLHLQDSLHVIFVVQLCGPTSQRYHTSLHAYSFALSTIEVVGAASQLLVVDIRTDVHLTGVNLHDASSGLLIWHGKLDLSVQAPWTEQSRIQDVHPVCGSNYLQIQLKCKYNTATGLTRIQFTLFHSFGMCLN